MHSRADKKVFSSPSTVLSQHLDLDSRDRAGNINNNMAINWSWNEKSQPHRLLSSFRYLGYLLAQFSVSRAFLDIFSFHRRRHIDMSRDGVRNRSVASSHFYHTISKYLHFLQATKVAISKFNFLLPRRSWLCDWNYLIFLLPFHTHLVTSPFGHSEFSWKIEWNHIDKVNGSMETHELWDNSADIESNRSAGRERIDHVTELSCARWRGENWNSRNCVNSNFFHWIISSHNGRRLIWDIASSSREDIRYSYEMLY